MLSPEAMDIIVEGVSAEICKENPTEECPMFVDVLLRVGLPMLAATADDAGFAQVFFRKDTFDTSWYFWTKQDLFNRYFWINKAYISKI